MTGFIFNSFVYELIKCISLSKSEIEIGIEK